MKKSIGLALLLASGVANAFVVNGDFESGLTGWTATGQVGVQSDYVYAGTEAAYIGTVDHDENDLNDYTDASATDDLNDHSLFQTVDISNPWFTEILIHYNYFTWDYDGFDEPGFQILVDDVVVFSVNAGDVSPNDDGILDSTDWQTFSIELSSYSGSIDLEINAGNTSDALYQSWAYVEVTSVPVPAAVWLFGSALGLLAFRCRR